MPDASNVSTEPDTTSPCPRCGSYGHFVKDCPVSKPHSVRQAEGFRAWAMADSDPHTVWHIERHEARSLFEQYEGAWREREEIFRQYTALLQECSGLREQLEATQKALADALDVAIWLSALVGNPDGANSDEATVTWQNVMRPRLFDALHVSNPASGSES